MPNVAIIGAGASGLAAAKCMQEAGITPVVLESSDRLGGLWNLDHEITEDSGPSYQLLSANTSKQTMSFSDFPMSAETLEYPSRENVLRYLRDYADHFGLKRFIRFNARVKWAEPMGDGRWRVFVRQGQDETDAIYDYLLVCNGIHRFHKIPEIPGLRGFQGQVLHSRTYRHHSTFSGARVLVVGAGSSAVDIAAEICRTANLTAISTHRNSWIIPKYIDGKPSDHLFSRFSQRLPASLRRKYLRKKVLEEYRAMGVDIMLEKAGFMNAPFDPDRVRITPSSEFLYKFRQGQLQTRPDLKSFDGQAALFEDGAAEVFDTVIFATGYDIGFPFLGEGTPNRRSSRPQLYRQVFSPSHRGLAFIGFARVQGPYPPLIEMQARWAAHVFRGRDALPAPEEMLDAIDREMMENDLQGLPSMSVRYLEYMEDLAGRIGASPNMLQHPRAAWKLFFGPFMPAQFRLDGPNRWNGAEEAILRGE